MANVAWHELFFLWETKFQGVNVTQWFASSLNWHQIIETDGRNVERRTKCFSDVSVQKFINEIHLTAAINRFLRSLALNKPFSVISDPAFTEANNKALEHLQKTSEKNWQHGWCPRAHKKR